MTDQGQTANGVERTGPTPVRRVPPLQEARERLSDFVETGIEPTADMRALIDLVLRGLDSCEKWGQTMNRTGRELLWALQPLGISGQTAEVVRFGTAHDEFTEAIK